MTMMNDTETDHSYSARTAAAETPWEQLRYLDCDDLETSIGKGNF